MNTNEPAAKCADKIRDEATNDVERVTAERIGRLIRQMPKLKSEMPVFTAEDIGRYEDGYAARQSVEGKRRHHIAACINDRLATFRPAPASEPDLQRMQEAWIRADNKYANSGNQSALFARYLAAEGFRLGEPAAAETNLYKDGYNTGRQPEETP